MILRDIPGVQRVAANEVLVDAEGRSDRVIEATVRSVIESVSGLDLGTLALQVTDGQVVLVGTVGSSSELDRVRALIRELRGVRSLKTFVTVSSDARIRDQALVKKIRKSLALRYPKHRISVSAFGNVAVLRGTVPLAKTREDIAKLVAIEPGVERVVNKLVVRRSSKGRNEP
jgi:osmotically-inducible protein OsmY